MDALNSLPINPLNAPAQRSTAETPCDKDLQGSSFENLLHEKSAPMDEQASVATGAQQPEMAAKTADGDELPSADELSALVSMFPVLPMLALQPAPTVPAPTAEIGFGEIASAALTDTRLPATTAIETPFETARPLPIATGMRTGAARPLSIATGMPPVLPAERGSLIAEPRGQANSVTPGIDSNVKVPFAIDIPRSPAAGAVSLPPTSAITPQPIAEPAPAAGPTLEKPFVPEPLVTARELPAEVRGISSAKQELVMPAPAKSRAPAPKAATSAADSGALESLTVPLARQGDARVAAATWQQNSGGERREEKPGFLPQTSDPAAPASTATSSFIAPAAPAEPPAAIVRTQVETIVHRTMEAAERLRITGGERVEVQIKLDAGQELTVRLQLTHGEVRPIFLTESRELRQALEQNWSQFADRATDRTVRVTTPVFESPNSQSGMNDLNQQQREGRQRAFAEAQEAAFANAPFGRNLPRRANAAAPSAAPAPGVQLYA